MSTPHVVIVGSFVQDLFFETEAFPRPGQSVVGRFRTAPGGKGFNQAVAAARAGAQAGFIGAIGCDTFGAGARAFLAAEKIEGRFIEKPEVASGTAAVTIDNTGQNQIVVALGANDALQPDEVFRPWLEAARVVICQLEISSATVGESLHIARARGACTILNPAPMRAEFDPAVLRDVDVLVPNEIEFAALVNRLPELGRVVYREKELFAIPGAELHSLCRRLGPGVVVVTLGARGCFLSQPDGWLSVPALTGLRVVDTTGAGDAFIGALAAAWLEFGGDVERCVRFANVAAGLSVQRPGAAPSMASRPEIDAAFSLQS